jgi:hypothetical protein
MLGLLWLVSYVMKILGLFRCLLLGFLLGGVSLAAGAEEVQWKSAGFLVDSFVEVALRSDYSSRKNPVRKWIVPVSYFIVHRVGDEDLHRKLIQAHFQQLAEITGLAIHPATSQSAANFLVVLTREDRLEADLPQYFGALPTRQRETLFRHCICMATFATERKGSITRAVAMIPVDAARARGDLVACMVEELTHALGLPNDSLKVFPSIFSRKSSHAFLTGLDHLMLKMLYDPRVKAGMKEAIARPILQAIADEYERDNRFAAVEQNAAQEGLAGFTR